MKAKTKVERFRSLYACGLAVFAIVALLVVTTEAKSISRKSDRLHLRSGVKIESAGKTALHQFLPSCKSPNRQLITT